jgi:hypothetical protein
MLLVELARGLISDTGMFFYAAAAAVAAASGDANLANRSTGLTTRSIL